MFCFHARLGGLCWRPFFEDSPMAYRQTNNSTNAAFSALILSSAPSSMTTTSLVATSSIVPSVSNNLFHFAEIVALLTHTVQAAPQASQLHPSPAMASSVSCSAACSLSPPFWRLERASQTPGQLSLLTACSKGYQMHPGIFTSSTIANHRRYPEDYL